jgi:hypothetical protein
LVYVAVPIAAGLLVGNGVRAKAGWKKTIAGWLVGGAPAARAWDAVFAPRPAAIVRGRLKESQTWVAGLFGDESYAAGYPDEPQDLFLEVAYRIGADGLLERDEEERPIPVGSGLLIRADELESIEIFPLETQP